MVLATHSTVHKNDMLQIQWHFEMSCMMIRSNSKQRSVNTARTKVACSIFCDRKTRPRDRGQNSESTDNSLYNVSVSQQSIPATVLAEMRESVCCSVFTHTTVKNSVIIFLHIKKKFITPTKSCINEFFSYFGQIQQGVNSFM